jgi:hypothetical protein
MKLGTIIKLPDGREGTICYHNLDGYGGVFGRHDFSGVKPGFTDDLPAPEFMLRGPEMQERFAAWWRECGYPPPECVGERYEALGVGPAAGTEVQRD